MKYKVKFENNKYVVMSSKDEVISTWSKKQVDDLGGIDKCVENFKKINKEDEVEMVGSIPAPSEPAAPAPTIPAPTVPAPAEPAAPAPAEPAPAEPVVPAPAKPTAPAPESK